jgi:hypothetical protein
MQPVRPAIAHDPRRFGRAVARAYPVAGREVVPSADLKLFLTTFAAGFLFVSVLIA